MSKRRMDGHINEGMAFGISVLSILISQKHLFPSCFESSVLVKHLHVLHLMSRRHICFLKSNLILSCQRSESVRQQHKSPLLL